MVGFNLEKTIIFNPELSIKEDKIKIKIKYFNDFKFIENKKNYNKSKRKSIHYIKCDGKYLVSILKKNN